MSNRIEKVNSLLQRYVSEIINQKINDPRVSGIISVSNVSTTPDWKHAKISLSIFTTNDKTETLKAIINASGFIRRELAKKVEFRTVPELTFNLDTTAEYSQKINKILDTLDVKEDWI